MSWKDDPIWKEEPVMALIKCPECGKEISDKAVFCPNCGFPLSENRNDDAAVYEYETVIPEEEPGISDKYIWLMAGAFALSIFLGSINAPFYVYFIIPVLEVVCIIKDSEQLEKAGIRISPIYIVLGLVMLVPIYVIARAVKTKRAFSGIIYFAVFVVIAIFSYKSYMDNKVSQELIDYINSDATRLAEIETEIIDSYNSVSGVNYTDDAAFYDEIKNVALPAAKRLISEANSVYSKLSSEEIKKAHSIYLDACNVYYEALEGMLEGVEKQDVTTIRKASEKLEQISELATDYQNAIKQLAEKYRVELQPIEQFIQL